MFEKLKEKGFSPLLIVVAGVAGLTLVGAVIVSIVIAVGLLPAI